MKLVRNTVLAVCLGIFGGLAVTIMSYYNHHKQDGFANTLLAVSEASETIREAYSDGGKKTYDWNVDQGVLAGGQLSSDTGEYIDDRIPALSDSVLSAFADITGDFADDAKDSVKNIFDSKAGDSDLITVNSGIDEDNPYADILRFHVRANSDMEEDQELKLAVRDDVIAMLRPLVSECESVAESKKILINNLQNIYITAVNTVTEQGYDYPVKVYVTVEEFPAKTYGDLTFPAGKYQALRIDIGNALGQNWWCVMYPPLCFIDEATVVVSDDGKEMLKDNMTLEEYEALLNNKETEIKGRSLLFDCIEGIFQKR